MSRKTDNEAYQNKLRKDAKLLEYQERKDTVEVMSMPEGRRFVARLLGLSRYLQSPVCVDPQGRVDQFATHVESGRRALGADIARMLMAEAPGQWLDMQRETLRESEEAMKRLKAAEAEEASDD